MISMQEKLIGQKLHIYEYHTRLWGMEVARGVVNIIFGVVLLTNTRFTLSLLFYALGIYLIVDGALDIFNTATGKHPTKRKRTNYLLGFVSIVLGIICFFHFEVTVII